MGYLKNFLNPQKKSVIIFSIPIFLFCCVSLSKFPEKHTQVGPVQFLPTNTSEIDKVILPLIFFAPSPSPVISTETLVPTEKPKWLVIETTVPTQITKGQSVDIEEGCAYGCSSYKDGCYIKGNISYETGERIYHVPGGEFYDRTVVNPLFGERWFCTEAEAIANGWRKSKR